MAAPDIVRSTSYTPAAAAADIVAFNHPAYDIVAQAVAVPVAEARNIVVAPEITRTANSSNVLAVPDSADINHGLNASESPAAGSGPRLNAPPASRLDLLVSLPGLRVDFQGMAIARNSILNVREIEAPTVPDASSTVSPLPLPRSPNLPPTASSTGDEAESVMPLSTPLEQVAGALSFMPPLNVAAVEQGMRRFLGQMQRVGEDLADPGQPVGLGFWLVAGAAAAVACEIARRQFRQPVTGLTLEGNWLAGSPPDRPFENRA